MSPQCQNVELAFCAKYLMSPIEYLKEFDPMRQIEPRTHNTFLNSHHFILISNLPLRFLMKLEKKDQMTDLIRRNDRSSQSVNQPGLERRLRASRSMASGKHILVVRDGNKPLKFVFDREIVTE